MVHSVDGRIIAMPIKITLSSRNNFSGLILSTRAPIDTTLRLYELLFFESRPKLQKRERKRHDCTSSNSPTLIDYTSSDTLTPKMSPTSINIFFSALFKYIGIVADSNAYDQSKRMRTGSDCTHTGYSSPSPFHPPPAPAWGPPAYMTPPPQPYDPYTGYHVPPVPMPVPAPMPAAPSRYVPVQNTKDNPPCNTLFIGNLGENINEEELRGLFTAQPGYKQMKVLRQERHIVCFIEFEDVQSATNVHHTLQGVVIPSSGAVGMRIQYPFSI
ncbi:PREDICTED: cell wall integrity protein scw1-like [Ipomoea nil]|uniref:cell wall integrity protein scw1-like n=1 Tax=Ipomoea nil TaxID=35883 RepID=UPI000901E1F7|nr:PREDICTED: cell wall integrity protein scw1-like [Ipomoea nil]